MTPDEQHEEIISRLNIIIKGLKQIGTYLSVLFVMLVLVFVTVAMIYYGVKAPFDPWN